MKLQKKILLMAASLFLLPVLMFSLAVWGINRYGTRQIRRTYGINEENVLRFSNGSRFDAVIGSFEEELRSLAEECPSPLGQAEDFAALEKRVKDKGGSLLLWTASGYRFGAAGMNSGLLTYLEQNGASAEGRTLYYAGENCQALTTGYRVRLSETEEGRIFLLLDVSDSLGSSRRLLILLLAAMALTLILTALLTAGWLERSLVKPLKNLKKATNAIAEGNLEMAVEPPAGSIEEIGALCRDFENMRLRLKDNAQEKLEQEQENRVLVSNISHDLKTPLTAVKGYVEGIQDGVASSPEKLDKYLRTIYNKVGEMDRLVDELTLYAKIDTNRIPYNFTKIRLQAYFADCVDELTDELNAQNVELSYSDLLEQETWIIGDPEQLHRVISNIISNSVKYMDKEKKMINIRVRDAEDFVRIELEDNGRGIAPRDLPRIFDRFYRADASRNSRTGGSGIGLSIVRKIVEDHGGRIWATSREGFGTTMCLELRKYEEGAKHEQDSDHRR